MKLKLTILLLLLVCPAIAQTESEKAVVRHERLRRIDFQHLNVGAEAAVCKNQFMGPVIGYGIGTYRNILTLDFGIKYMLINPIGRSEEERISVHNLPVWAAANVNVMRWHWGGIYVGGEISYSFVATANHRKPFSEVVEYDNHIGNNHASVSGKMGIRLSRMDVNVHYCYDLSPAINQKYVFETAKFDYDFLKANLYERYRIGLSVSYLIPIEKWEK